MNRWLITGGCGFIGTNLVNDIIAIYPDDKIIIIDDLRNKTKKLPKNLRNVEFHPIDVEKIYKIGTPEIDYFVHLAAETNVRESMKHPEAILLSNYNNLVHCLSYAKNADVKKFIFASSAGCVGNNPMPLDEQSPFNPESPYASSKLCGEVLCDIYSKLGLKTVSLRFSNFYGIHSSHKESVVISFMDKIINDEPIEVYGSGKQTRDFIYVNDIVDAIIKSATSNIEGVYCISSNTETSINELIRTIEFVLDKKARIITLPNKKGEMLNSLVNNMKAVNSLSFLWSPRIKLIEGIKKMANWLKGKVE